MADDPHIVVTDSIGQVSVLLRRGSPVNIAPTTGLSQVVTTGDTALRTDQRTPQFIVSDQRGGEALLRYTEIEGNNAFYRSDLDARWPEILALPPAYPSVLAHGADTGVMGFVEYLGIASVTLIVWGWLTSATTSARRYDVGTGAFTTITTGGTGISNLTGFSYFAGRYVFATTNSSMGLYTSTDGLTWANSAKGKACIGLAVHDNKLWTWNDTDKTLDFTFDPTQAHLAVDGFGVPYWGTSTVLYLHPGEVVRQVEEWRLASNRAAIYMVTNRRVLWYDEDADSFLDFDQLWRRVGSAYASTFYPRIHIGLRDGNAYVTLYNTNSAAPKQGQLLQYSGVTQRLGPRVLPRWSRWPHRFRHLADDGTWLYTLGNADVYPHIMALGETGGFTTYYNDLAASDLLVGGGYGDGRIYALTATDMLVPVMVTDAHPLYDGGWYRTGGFDHEYGYTDGGTPGMWKQALWLTVDCLDMSHGNGGVSGLASDTLVNLYYRVDDETATTFVGTVTTADTFPKSLPINGGAGVAFHQIQPVIGMGTSLEGRTPVVASLAVAYIRMEEPRFSYTVVADLADRDHALYREQDIAQLRARIASWARPGSIVRLDFAGGDWGDATTADNPSTATSVPSCTVAYSATDDPERGPQYMTLVFNDVSAPS